MISAFRTLEQLRKNFDRSNYIKSSSYNPDKQACIICMEPVCFPLRCKGCKILVCTVCARKWLYNKKRCPQKCTETQWHLIPEVPTGIEFKCPYDGRCVAYITAESYDDHLVDCMYAPPEAKNLLSQQDLKSNYLCTEAHKLEFIGRQWLNMVQTTTCQLCSSRNLIRSKCTTCSHSFCSQCRPLKNLTNRHCPQGHSFLIRDTRLTDVFCDICSKRILQIGGGFCYNQPICDFAVCIHCFHKLPRDNSGGDGYEREDPRADYLQIRQQQS